MGFSDEFRKGLGGETFNEAVDRREVSWESTVVRHAMGVFEIPKKAIPGRPTMADWRKLCPSFPVWLQTLRIPYPHKLMDDVFDATFNMDGVGKTKFFRGRFVNALQDAIDMNGSGYAGCVFPYPVVQSMIIHNYSNTNRGDGARFEIRLNDRCVYIEPFRQFLRQCVLEKHYLYEWDDKERR